MPRLQVSLDGTAVDGWLAVLSTEFPEDEFRIVATQLREDGALVVLEVRTPRGEALVECFEDAPEVHALEVLHADEQTVLLQFVTRSSRAYNPLVESKTVSVYPTILQDGRFTVTVMAPHERLSRYTDELAAAGIPYQIVSLAQSFDSTELLTDRQAEVVTLAVERGYYDTPRGCTVTELSDALGIEKSSASRLLHRAESRIVTQFVAGTTIAPPRSSRGGPA